jgi:hypothetical protein
VYAGLPWPLGRNLRSGSDRGLRGTLPGNLSSVFVLALSGIQMIIVIRGQEVRRCLGT